MDRHVVGEIVARVADGRAKDIVDELGELRNSLGSMLDRAFAEGHVPAVGVLTDRLLAVLDRIDKMLEREHEREAKTGPVNIVVTYDDDGNEQTEATFDSLAALDTEIRKLEAAVEARGLNPDRLDDDERDQLRALISKMGDEPDDAESTETGEEEPSRGGRRRRRGCGARNSHRRS